MQTLFLRKGLSGHTMAAIFIHDLIPNVLSAVLPDTSGFSVIDANKKAACCQGCFRCWLASPGQCVMKDDLQTVGAQIGSCEKAIIFSRCCYGGFSPGVKKVLDRAISLSLPFFTHRGGIHSSFYSRCCIWCSRAMDSIMTFTASRSPIRSAMQIPE